MEFELFKNNVIHEFYLFLVCFLRSTSLFGFSKMTHDTILALSIAKKDNTACHNQHHCSSYTLG